MRLSLRQGQGIAAIAPNEDKATEQEDSFHDILTLQVLGIAAYA
jgi:hypothetical protein